MFKQIILFITALFIPISGFSTTKIGETLYKVEMIVFTHITQKNYQSELWAQPVANQNLLTIKPSNIEDLNRVNYNLLTPDQYELNHEEKLLQSTTNRKAINNYQVIEHSAWLQSISKYKEFTVPVTIQGNRWFNKNGTLITNKNSQNTQELIPELTGNVTIKLNRYFNTSLNLILNIPTKLLPKMKNSDHINKKTSEFYQFHMNQVRRTRSGELNYFDHPLFGVIFKISKVKN